MHRKGAQNRLLVLGSIAYDCIETPVASEDYILGGSASYAGLAASFFAPVDLVGAVGNDFKQSDIDRLKAHGIGLDNVVRFGEKPSFFWRGKYFDDFNTRETIDVRMNCYEDYAGATLNDSARSSKYALLGNISTQIQAGVFGQLNDPSFVMLDTMDLWIRNSNECLRELVGKVDVLVLNDSEARLFADTSNLICAGDRIIEMGAKSAIIKTGEYGAMLFHEDGFFTLPAYPVRALHDPTGAGDTFAGALAGYVASKDSSDFETLKMAMVYGAAAASIAVESFSCYKLEETGMAEIRRRADYIMKITKI
ncbi:MAG: sugar kinase [Verrucomicrobia bacterium]|nr:MAG: sugar kinase [Verrucomicrobiota bacterium]